MSTTTSGAPAAAVYALAAVPHAGVLFAACGTGLLRSDDGAASWQPALTALALSAPLPDATLAVTVRGAGTSAPARSRTSTTGCVGSSVCVTDSPTHVTMALETLTIVPGFGVRVLQQQVSQTGDSVSLPVLRTVGARSPGEILMVASPKSEESGDCNKNKKAKTT